MKTRIILVLLLFCWPLLIPTRAAAHAVGNGYLALRLEHERVDGQLRIARADLDAAIGLDRDADGRADDADVAEARDAIESYLLSRIELSNARGACPFVASDLRPDANYVVLEVTSVCPDPSALRYDLLFEHDRAHQAYLRVQGGLALEHVFTRDRRSVSLRAASSLSVFGQYLAQGVHHILIGADHLLFLLTLLLAAVVCWNGRRPEPAPSPRAAALGLARIVTAFTAAHSVTLSLTALGLVAPPSRWVEIAIALSVVAAAANNIWPVVTRRPWLLALAFGLIHGCGFAAALAELGLPQGQRTGALLGFNLGVELGQLAVVSLAFPPLFWLRRHAAYPRVVLAGGSVLIGVVGLAWAFERAVGVPSTGERRVAGASSSARDCAGLPVLGEPRLEAALSRTGPAVSAIHELACAGELERAALSAAAVDAASLPAPERAALLRLHAEIEDARQATARAEALLAQAASVWRELRAQGELADSLARAGELAARAERWADVYRSYDEARALHEQIGDLASLARDHARLGDVLVSAADTREARKHYERARDASEASGDPAAVARQYRNLAIVARLEADPTAAAQMYRRAIDSHRARGDQPALGADLAALARVHAGLGEHAEAMVLYEEAIGVETRLGRSRYRVRAYNQLGNLHQLRGALELAEQTYRRAVELGANDPVEAANAWANLASVEQQRGRPVEARALYEHSLALFEEGGAKSKAYRVRALLASLASPASAVSAAGGAGR